MARSTGRAAVIAVLCALGYSSSQIADFVGDPALRELLLGVQSSSPALRSRVSLAATSADVEAAFKELKLQQWVADKLASEGSPLAAAAAGRVAAAENAYNSAKAASEGKAAPVPVAAAPVAAVAAAPMAAAPVATSAVSAADLAEAKKRVELLTWSANKLASEGSPQAGAMQAKADQAVASYNALKQAKGTGAMAAAAPVAAAVPVAAAAPVAAAPMAAAPVAAGGASAEDIKEAKKQVDLLTWAAKQLASQGSPQAGPIQAKADAAVAAYNAMKQGGSAPAFAAPAAAAPAPVAAAPVAAAPVAAAVAVTPAVASGDLKEAKKQAELLTWAAEALAQKGSPQAAPMAAKAQQATAAYEAMRQTQMAGR